MSEKIGNILLISIICVVVYFIWILLLVLFLRLESNYWDFGWIFLLVMLFIFPIAFGIFGYIRNRNAIISCLIYFIITFIFFLWFQATNGNYAPWVKWEDSIEEFIVLLILTFECLIATLITKLIIKRKIKL